MILEKVKLAADKPWVIYDLLNIPLSLLISLSGAIAKLLLSEQSVRNKNLEKTERGFPDGILR